MFKCVFHMWDAYGVKQEYAFQFRHRLHASASTTITKNPTAAPTAETLDGSNIHVFVHMLAVGGFK